MDTKTVYKYDSNGYYTGTLILDDTNKSPLGDWNIPANCVEIAPTIKDGYISKWNGTAWVQEQLPVNVLCYYNNGLSYHTEKSNYAVQAGEVLFTTTPTTDQLAAAFNGYTAAALSQAQNTKISKIDALLKQTDYEAIKYAEGIITADQYTNLKAARIAWRTAINTIQACTTIAAVDAVTYSTDIPSV